MLGSIHISKAEFDALPEYSRTIPTGLTVGRRWKQMRHWPAPPDSKQMISRWIVCVVAGRVQSQRSGSWEYQINNYYPVIRVPAGSALL